MYNGRDSCWYSYHCDGRDRNIGALEYILVVCRLVGLTCLEPPVSSQTLSKDIKDSCIVGKKAISKLCNRFAPLGHKNCTPIVSAGVVHKSDFLKVAVGAPHIYCPGHQDNVQGTAQVNLVLCSKAAMSSVRRTTASAPLQLCLLTHP